MAKPPHPATLAAQALGWVDDATRAVIPAIHPSTTYLRDPDNQYRSGRVYGRADNPTYDQAEALLAQLEGGAEASLFASGMAAATAVFMALAPGDHVVVPSVMYWSLRNWLLGPATAWGIQVSVVDTTRPAEVQAALRPGQTRLLWLETPGNPLWDISDIAALSSMAHKAGAQVAVDSTVATPVLTRPLELGADIVMHAATKYLNGHSDVVAGALVCRAADAFWGRIKAVRVQHGGILGPFEAWLLLRGMRTLFVRVPAMCRSASAIAAHFERHDHVAQVLYPGLIDFPGHAIAARQMQGGFGAMLSLRVAGGAAHAVATAAGVKLWKRATSLGGVESLIEHRASIEGANSPVPPDLLRLSVGIEDTGDLIADLEHALAGGA